MNMMEIFLYFCPTLLAGFVHGVTGFGFGIVLMMFYPFLMGVASAVSITQCLAVFLSLFMAAKYRQGIQWTKLIRPLLIYFPVYFVVLRLVAGLDVEFLKPVLGVFLILLSLYFLFFSKTAAIKGGWGAAFICICLAAACDASFGIGGPALVLYFMAVSKSKEQYLGTIQAFLLIANIYGTGVRIANGLLGMAQLPIVMIGAVAMLCGFGCSVKVVERLNEDKIRMLVYNCIGFAGVITLITSLI